MGVVELFLLAVGLSMDAFAVSVCKGLSTQNLKWKHYLTIGLWFGGFQALMPTIGYFLGSTFEAYITSVDHWVAFVLLSLIGGNMLREGLSKDEPEERNSSFSFKTMLVLAVATSIDALAVGITFALLPDVNLPAAVSFIGATTFILSAVGLKVGNVFGLKYKSRAEIAGGIILILLGVKILLEHLGVRKTLVFRRFLLWMQDVFFAALAGEQKDLPCLRLELQRVQRAAEARVVEADERVVEHDRRPRREGQTAHGQPQREIERVLRPGAQIPAGAERRFGGLARHDIHLAIQQHPVIFPAGQRGEELARLLGERRGEAPLHFCRRILNGRFGQFNGSVLLLQRADASRELLLLCGESRRVAQGGQCAAILIEAGLDGSGFHIDSHQFCLNRYGRVCGDVAGGQRLLADVGQGGADGVVLCLRVCSGYARRIQTAPRGKGSGNGAGRIVQRLHVRRQHRGAADQLRSLAVLFIQQTLALRGGVGQLLARLPPRVEARCILGCVRGKFVAAAIPVAYKERLGRVHIGLILAVMPAVEDKFDSSGEGQRSADGAKWQIF